MLHRIKMPPYSTVFEHILAFQRMLLVYLCGNTGLTEPDMCAALGTDIGKWFYKKTIGQKGENKGKVNSFGTALNSLHDYAVKNPAFCSRLLDAFDNDISFHVQKANGDYHFLYPTFLEAERKLIKPVMAYFYDLLDDGFPNYVTQSNDAFTRSIMVETFWRENSTLKVCPACDNTKPDTVRGKVASPADHHLPRSQYPYLSVHPTNLVPTCTDCNSYAKLDRDPLLESIPFNAVFHPYLNPVIDNVQVRVVAPFGSPTTRKVEIIDRTSMPSPRLEHLITVYDLPRRWTQRLPHAVISPFVDTIVSTRQQLLRYAPTLTEQDLAEALHGQLRDEKKQVRQKIGQRPNALLACSYLEYAETNAMEFDELFKTFMAA